MAIDVQEAATRKIGPLPAWGWGVAIGVGFVALRFVRGSGGGTTTTVIQPTDPAAGGQGEPGEPGEPGGPGETGATGPAGPAGPAGQISAQFTAALNQIFDYQQELYKSIRFQSWLRDQLAKGNLTAAQRSRYTQDLQRLEATGVTTAGSKFTAVSVPGNLTFYNLDWLSKTIDALQKTLDMLRTPTTGSNNTTNRSPVVVGR